MEATRQKYETKVHQGEDGKITEMGESKGKVETFEFGSPDDTISAVIGGGYIPQFSPDFLQTELGRKDGLCGRYYFDKKTGVDIGDPSSKTSKSKRELMFKNGFGYLCIPENFSQEIDPLRNLYKSMLAEYEAYEKLHPIDRPTQQVTFIDSGGKIRTAQMRAIDVKVGGGMLGSPSEQEQDFQNATTLSKSEEASAIETARVMKAIRKASEKNQPFRNPFIGKHGKRKFNIEYASQ